MIEVSEALNLLLNLLVAGAACAAAIAAFMGLDTWKKERKWNRDVELSEDLLVLMFRRRDAISNLRNSFISYVPATHDSEGNQITDSDHASFVGILNYYQERTGKLEEIRSEIYGKRLRAAAVWGEVLNEMLSDLFVHEQKLITAVRRYLISMNPQVPRASREIAGRHANMHEILYEDPGEVDEYRVKYETLFLPIEQFLRQKLEVIK